MIAKTANIDLKDKICLVTGASKGIGRAVALHYARQGATVILLARSVKDLEGVYDEIVALGYPTPIILPFHLTMALPKDYETLLLNINQEFGKLDILHHNAAQLSAFTPIEHYSISEWFETLQTNLNSAFLLTRLLIPLLKKSNAASVVFTLDQQAEKNGAYWGAYGVSKIALKSFAEILRQELEHTHITVELLYPRPTKTNLRKLAFPAEDPETLSKTEDIALLL